jgi:hypothetical protein
MTNPTYFSDFLAKIRPSKELVSACVEGHQTLRDNLSADEDLGPIIFKTFLQGSYRRSTAIEPQGEKKLDVDVVVVTKLAEKEFNSKQALELFQPFVEEYYPEQHEEQGRSIGLHLEDVDLDLVVTSAPSEAQMGIISVLAEDGEELDEDSEEDLVKALVEARTGQMSDFSLTRAELIEKAIKAAREKEQWEIEPLRIPDRESDEWRDTHPIAQMEWTIEKNQLCNKHYINVVKAIKWWRAMRQPEPKYPKGYPLEHLIGACCPDGITSVAEGVTLTLEAISSRYSSDAASKTTPELMDHGVNYDVFQRVDGEDFAAFHGHVAKAAKIARQALNELDSKTSASLWYSLFGDPFPKPPSGNGDNSGSDGPSEGGGKGGFTSTSGSTNVTRERFGQSSES